MLFMGIIQKDINKAFVKTQKEIENVKISNEEIIKRLGG